MSTAKSSQMPLPGLPPSRTAAQFVVRFPVGMRDRIAEAAKANNRSMNAQIVHMLQGHFDEIDARLEQQEASQEAEQALGVSLGLKEASDRSAVLKVLLLEELMLLKRRVSQLGGKSAVLKAPKHEIAKSIEGARIKGTKGEQASYYSQLVSTTPLTAILSTEEIDKLASRMIEMQSLNTVRFGNPSRKLSPEAEQDAKTKESPSPKT